MTVFESWSFSFSIIAFWMFFFFFLPTSDFHSFLGENPPLLYLPLESQVQLFVNHCILCSALCNVWNIYRWYPPNGFMQYFAKEKVKLYFSIMYFLKSFISDQKDSTIFDSNRACNSVRNYISLVLMPFAYCLWGRRSVWLLTWTRFFRNPGWTLFIILRSLIYLVSEFSCFRANSYKLGLLLWEQTDCGDTVSSSVYEPKSCFSSKTLGGQLGLFLLGYFIITYCWKVTIIFCSAMHGIHSSHLKILKGFLKKPQGPTHFSLLECKSLVFFEAYNIVNSPPMQSNTLIVAAVLWYEWLKLFSRNNYEQNTFRIVKLFLISLFSFLQIFE